MSHLWQSTIYKLQMDIKEQVSTNILIRIDLKLACCWIGNDGHPGKPQNGCNIIQAETRPEHLLSSFPVPNL